MTQRKEIANEDIERVEDEEREDYLDYCAAAEAIDEALETREITSLEDFIKELAIEGHPPTKISH